MGIEPVGPFLAASRRNPAGEADRLGQRKSAFVKGAADQAPRDRKLGQTFQVAQLADPSRGDHGRPHDPAERSDRREVWALQRTVAGDVGVDHAGKRQVVELLGQVDRHDRREIKPTSSRHPAVVRVQAQKQPAGITIPPSGRTTQGPAAPGCR